MIPQGKLQRELSAFRKGERVKMQAFTDRFMMGDVYGTVTHVGCKLVHVALDRSGQTRKFHPSWIEHVG